MDENPSAVNEPVVADTTPTESAPVETASSEVVEDEFDGLGDVDLRHPSEEPAKEPEAEPKKQSEEAPEPEEQPRGKAEDRKQQLNTEIRDLVAQRNAIKTEVEQLTNKVYQPTSEQDLLGQINPESGEYYTSLEAKVTAMEQRQEIERYNSQISDTRLTLTSEANRAVQEFPMFDQNSPEFKPEIAAGVDQILGENLIRDPNIPEIDPSTGQPTGRGLVIGSHISPYQLYKTVANAMKAAAIEGQVSAQKATEKRQATADHASDAPSRTSGDAMEDLFDKVKDFKFTA